MKIVNRATSEPTEKWVCNRCGRERTDKPAKNEICNHDGCKGRFQRFASCKKCGEWFQAPQGATVCVECGRQKRIGSVDVVCAQCGRTFKRYNSNAKGKKQFCNKECQRKYEQSKMEIRTCKECGAVFQIRRSAIEHTNASGNFCSRECYHKNMRDERTTKYKGDFERVKRENFHGKQFCAICGTTKDIHIHHIIPYRLTHDNDISNLIPLCATHHAKLERATRRLVDTTNDLVAIKEMLNIMFRTRQQDTKNAIIDAGVKAGRKRNVSQNA